jgi:HK97 family phage prohead protease
MSETVSRRFDAAFELGDGRTVIGRCVPYNTPSMVADGDGGVPYTEVFRPGAFRRCVRAAPRVELRHEHDETITGRIGRARVLREEPDGLYGEFAMVDGTVGDHALELVRAGILHSMSVHAVVYPHGTHRLDDGTIERTLASLLHVGLTSTPAYETARVLAVRTGPVSAVDEMRDITARLRVRSPRVPS